MLDYSFNTNLTQFGGFLAFEKDSEKGQTQTSVAIAEQKYYGETYRDWETRIDNGMIVGVNPYS